MFILSAEEKNVKLELFLFFSKSKAVQQLYSCNLLGLFGNWLKSYRKI